MVDIVHDLTIRAPVETVYRAVTEQEGLAGWWTRETVASPREGSIAEFKFGVRYNNKMKITELKPNRRVAWECLEGDAEWVGTRFTFDLEGHKDGAALRFGHRDWRESTDFFKRCSENWVHYLCSLKKYCETGTGDPFHPEPGGNR